MMIRLSIFSFLLALQLPSGFCHAEDKQEPAQHRVLVDKIAAIVNNDIITLQDINKLMLPILPQLEQIKDEPTKKRYLAALKARVLDNLIDMKLVLQEAYTLNLEVQDSDIEAHLEQVKAQNKWTDEELEKEIQKIGFTMTEYRKQMRDEYLKHLCIQYKVDSRIKTSTSDIDKVLNDYYYGGKSQDEVKIAHILINVPEWYDDVEVQKARKLAKKLAKEAESGEKEFEDLVTDWTDDETTDDNGGVIGYVKRGTFGDEFDDVVFNAPVGSIIGPVQTQYGIHVIKILDKKKVDVKDLDELKNEITIQMKMKAREKIMKQWIKGLRARAFVENFGFD